MAAAAALGTSCDTCGPHARQPVGKVFQRAQSLLEAHGRMKSTHRAAMRLLKALASTRGCSRGRTAVARALLSSHPETGVIAQTSSLVVNQFMQRTCPSQKEDCLQRPPRSWHANFISSKRRFLAAARCRKHRDARDQVHNPFFLCLQGEAAPVGMAPCVAGAPSRPRDITTRQYTLRKEAPGWGIVWGMLLLLKISRRLASDPQSLLSRSWLPSTVCQHRAAPRMTAASFANATACVQQSLRPWRY